MASQEAVSNNKTDKGAEAARSGVETRWTLEETGATSSSEPKDLKDRRGQAPRRAPRETGMEIGKGTQGHQATHREVHSASRSGQKQALANRRAVNLKL